MAVVDTNVLEPLAAPAGERAVAAPGANGRAAGVTDFDLHGIVGIRLIGASPADAAAVSRQLGPIEKPLNREPDIVVRFVERLRTAEPMFYLGAHEAAFTPDEFLVLRGKQKSQVRVQIPFADIGRRCEIVCESGLPAVPLLIPIINLTALAGGFVPLHAAAFIHEGRGVVTTGWSKGGKTETLLAFMARGATYVGDEWIYLSPDGSRVFGIPEPITVWDWHLRQMPQIRSQVGWKSRARLGGVGAAVKLLGAISSNRLLRKLPAAGLCRRMLPLLKRQLCVNVDPTRAFGDQGKPGSAPFDALVYVASHDSPEVLVSDVAGREIAERMVHSLHEERADFLSYYTQYRFALPDRRNDFIERASETEREALLRIFETKQSYGSFHPYPVSIPALHDTLAPRLREDIAAAKTGAL